jgi:hypothetical protein
MDSAARFVLIIIVTGIPAFIILWGIVNISLGFAYDVGEFSISGLFFIGIGLTIYFLEIVIYTFLKREGYIE